MCPKVKKPKKKKGKKKNAEEAEAPAQEQQERPKPEPVQQPEAPPEPKPEGAPPAPEEPVGEPTPPAPDSTAEGDSPPPVQQPVQGSPGEQQDPAPEHQAEQVDPQPQEPEPGTPKPEVAEPVTPKPDEPEPVAQEPQAPEPATPDAAEEEDPAKAELAELIEKEQQIKAQIEGLQKEEDRKVRQVQRLKIKIIVERSKDSKKELAELQTRGADVADLFGKLDEIAKAVQDKELDNLPSVLDALDTDITKRKGELVITQVKNMIEAFSNNLDEAMSEGLEDQRFASAVNELEEAAGGLDPMDIDSAAGFLNTTGEKLNSLGQELAEARAAHKKQVEKEAAEGVIKEMEDKLSAADQQWDLTASSAFIEETKGLLAQERFSEVAPRMEAFDKTLDEAKFNYFRNLAMDRVAPIKEILKYVKEAGVDITEYAERLGGIKPFLESRDYDNLIQHIDSLENDARTAKAVHLLELASQAVEAFKPQIEAAKETGMDTSRFDTELSGISGFAKDLKPEDHEEVQKYHDLTMARVPELENELSAEKTGYLKSQAKEAAEAVISAMNEKLGAADQEWDLEEARAFVEETKGILAEERFEDVMPRAETLDGLLEGAKDRFLQKKVMDKVLPIKERMTELKELGIPVKELASKLGETKPMMEAKEYDRIFEHLDALEGETKEKKGNYLLEQASQAMQEAESAIQASKESGFDAVKFEEELRSNIEKRNELDPGDLDVAQQFNTYTLERMPKLIQECQAAEAEFIKTGQKGAAEGALKEMEELLSGCEDTWDLEAIKVHIEVSRKMVSEEQFSEVPQRAVEFKELVTEAKHNHYKNSTVERVAPIKEELKALKELGVEVTPFAERLASTKEILQNKEYDSIAAHLDELEKDIKTQRGTHLLKMSKERIEQFRSKIQDAADTGMDVSKFTSDADGMSAAGDSLDPGEIDKVQGYHDMVMQNMPDSEAALEDEKNDYLNSNKKEAAQGVLNSMKEQLADLADKGLELSAAEEIVNACEQAFTGEDFDSIPPKQEEFNAALESAKVTKAKTEAAGKVQDAKGLLRQARDAGAEIESLVQQLEPLKDLSSNGEYGKVSELADSVKAQAEELLAKASQPAPPPEPAAPETAPMEETQPAPPGETTQAAEPAEAPVDETQQAASEDVQAETEPVQESQGSPEPGMPTQTETVPETQQAHPEIPEVQPIEEPAEPAEETPAPEAETIPPQPPAETAPPPEAAPPPPEESESPQVGSSILDQLKQETLKEQAELELEKVQANITIAKNEGWDQKPFEAAIEEMNKLLAANKFEEALALGVKTNKEAKPPEADHVDPEVVQNTIDKLQLFIDKAPTILDTEEAKNLLKKARDVLADGDTSTALKHAKECKTNLKEKGDVVNKIKSNLKKASNNVVKNKAAGKDTTVTEELMRKAKAALKARDYTQAVRHSEDAVAKSEG